jgi:NADPH:quinone reductase-like Zn-dependent oxidoreductase
MIGIRSGSGGDLNVPQVVGRQSRLTGYTVGSRAMFEAMNRAIAVNGLRPIIDRRFPFADAVNAYREFAAGHHFGKGVISLA